MTAARRIGILGGTFDPVHIAHLHIAVCAKHELGLDEVRFVPAGSPPHKPGQPVTSGSHRLRMLEIATVGFDVFVPDPIDLADEVPSYTSDLLARIRKAHPDDQLWFIMGGDSLTDFPRWHQPRRILSLARLAVVERPGWDAAEALGSSPLPELAGRVDRFPSVPIDLSATLIRARVAAGQPVDWLVPAEVLAYIHIHGLYALGHGTD
ncbi:MAG TPA: nicotinate-nucleotide adenylyltransferase [Thermomicrobiales bacterium]|nr:nicotinate-nucleotide adenylyltransferase [Thermomicrobiales bacterium]